MNALSQAFSEALGLTLLDSLWQGAIILLICTIALALMRSRPARWRYRLVLVSLLALPITGIITFMHHYEQDISVSTESVPWQMSTGPSLSTVPEMAAETNLGLIERWQYWAAQNADWVVTFWAIGLMIFALRLTGGFYMLRKLLASAKPVEVEYWGIKLKELSKSLNIRWSVQIRESARVTSPIVVGYLKPMIIFPLGLIQCIPTDQVEAILLHELAHIKRHDYLLNLLVSLLQVIYFYHPAYWWLQQQLDTEREYSCDDLVLRQMNRLSLIKALTAVKEFQMNQVMPVMGFAGQKNQLLKRVERIMKKKTKTNWLGGLVSMTALLLSFFLMSYRSSDSSESIEFDLYNPFPVEEVKVDQAQDIDSHDIGQSIDSVTIEQAVMQLLDPKGNEIILELDGKGHLVDMMRNGESIGQAELKIYQQAHAKIRNYQFSESKLIEEQAVSQEKELRQLKLIEELYKVKLDLIRREQRNSEKKLSEEYRLKLQEYERLLLELKSNAAQDRDREVEISRNLDELLRYYPELIEHYKKGRNGWNKLSPQDSIQIKVHTGARAEEMKAYEIKVQELKERIEVVERAPVTWRQTIAIEDELAERVDELKALQRELRERDYVSPRNFDFAETTGGEDKATKVLSEISLSTERPLVVVDGAIKENWGIKDINKLDRSLRIKSVDLVRARNVIDERYIPYMKDRDYLFLVATAPGGRKYQRPEIEFGILKTGQQIEVERMENFTKTAMDRLRAAGLAENSSTLRLTSKGLYIDEEKQSKKLHKEYLKLYEDIMGRKLEKNNTVEMKK